MAVIKRNDSTEKILFERKRIDITGPHDRLTVLIFVIAFAISGIAGAICLEFTDLVMLDLSLFATLPLVVLGAFHLLRSKVYRYLFIVLAAAVGSICSVLPSEHKTRPIGDSSPSRRSF